MHLAQTGHLVGHVDLADAVAETQAGDWRSHEVICEVRRDEVILNDAVCVCVGGKHITKKEDCLNIDGGDGDGDDGGGGTSEKSLALLSKNSPVSSVSLVAPSDRMRNGYKIS